MKKQLKHYLIQIFLSLVLTLILLIYIEGIRAKSINVMIIFGFIMLIVNNIHVSIHLYKDKKPFQAFIKYILIILFSLVLFYISYLSLLLLLKLIQSNLYYTLHNYMNLLIMLVSEVLVYLNKTLVIIVIIIEIIKMIIAEICFFYDESKPIKKGLFILIYIVIFISLRKLIINHFSTTQILIYEIVVSTIKIIIFLLIMKYKKLLVDH